MRTELINFQDFFANGMKRKIVMPQSYMMVPREERKIVNLGAGNHPLPEPAHNLDLPDWQAPQLPYKDESVDEIHAYHFFEHLTGELIRFTLYECQRVLKVGGLLFIVVPYWHSDLAHQDLDHKRTFTEDTWRVLMYNEDYDTSLAMELNWDLDIVFNLIAGLQGRNLGIFTIMERVESNG